MDEVGEDGLPHIDELETISVVLATATWGPFWTRRHVLCFWVDNEVV